MRGVFQAAAGERYQALIAAHLDPLIDCHRQVAASHHLAGRRLPAAIAADTPSASNRAQARTLPGVT